MIPVGLYIQCSSNWDKATEGCVVLSNIFLSQILWQDFPEICKPDPSPEDAHWRAALQVPHPSPLSVLWSNFEVPSSADVFCDSVNKAGEFNILAGPAPALPPWLWTHR